MSFTALQARLKYAWSETSEYRYDSWRSSMDLLARIQGSQPIGIIIISLLYYYIRYIIIIAVSLRFIKSLSNSAVMSTSVALQYILYGITIFVYLTFFFFF